MWELEPYLIVYETRKKEIIYRIVKYEPMYKNHSYTSMGWYIIDIQRFYKGRFIPLKEYDQRVKEEIEIYNKKYKKKRERKINKFNRRKYLINKIFSKYIDGR